VISEAKGMSLDAATVADLGRAKRAILTGGETTIVDGQGDSGAIERRCEQIRSQIPDVQSDFDRKMLRERAAKLSGGIALIRVGGATEAEIAERRQRYESAVAATRAALAEGILPGGGVALLRAAASLPAANAANDDQRAGIAVLARALEAPLRRIAANAKVNQAMVVQKVLESNDPAVGFDAVSGTYRDMIEAGIVDAAQVVRTALATAASVGGMLVTVGAVIARDPEPPPLPLDERPFGPESPDMLPEDLDRFGLR
jgi:chaperonin GroEL